VGTDLIASDRKSRTPNQSAACIAPQEILIDLRFTAHGDDVSGSSRITAKRRKE